MRKSLVLVASVMGFICLQMAHADAAPSEPGVVATFESLETANTLRSTFSDMRASRLLALYVGSGDAPTPFMAPGRFRVTFEGNLTLRLRDFLAFSAQGRGKLTLTINGKPVLNLIGDSFPAQPTEPIRLNKGKNHVVAVYESPSAGDAAFRIFWSSRTFKPEPIPPHVLSHDSSSAKFRESEQTREGRFLLGEFRCTKCHTTPAAAQSGAMPELIQDAPSLAGAGARFRPAWLAAWINNPHSLRSGAHMPRLFHGGNEPSIDSRAADVAAYLASISPRATKDSEPADPAKIAAGGRLFTQFDCVACHSLPDANKSGAAAANDQRVPLRYVKEKFQPGALRRFLEDPAAHYAWNPMPNFHLSPDEAEVISAFLLSYAGAKLDAAPPGNAEHGKLLMESAGCLNCHAIENERTALKAASLEELPKEVWTRGCVASDAAARKNAPEFLFSTEQSDALRAFAGTDRTSLHRTVAEEFTTRQMHLLRCTACHARDGSESLLGTTYDAEESALQKKYPPSDSPNQPVAADQRAPLLTWAGEKLRPRWTAAFIGGKLNYKPRPFLRARMPSFPARAPRLATGLAAQHGYDPITPKYPPPDVALAAIGQKLCGTTPNESFSCVQCHSVATQPPKAAFEAPSINFMYVRERLRKEYYQRWIHDPLRVDPNTKMPRFDDADDLTGIHDVFDGNAPRQFEAIWQYLLEGREIQPPP